MNNKYTNAAKQTHETTGTPHGRRVLKALMASQDAWSVDVAWSVPSEKYRRIDAAQTVAHLHSLAAPSTKTSSQLDSRLANVLVDKLLRATKKWRRRANTPQ
jgi:hypothetical protein